MMLTTLIARALDLRAGLPRTSLTGLEDSALAEVWTSQIREEVLTFPGGSARPKPRTVTPSIHRATANRRLSLLFPVLDSHTDTPPNPTPTTSHPKPTNPRNSAYLLT